MLKSRLFPIATCVAVLIGLVAFGASAAPAEAKTEYEKLIDDISPSLVTLKCVLKMQGPGGAREVEREFTALMIDNKGTVLCASVQLGTSKLMRRYGTITPTDIKVLIGEDTEGVEAKLLASDSELDLSWVQIKKPDAKGYAHVDFAKATTVNYGDRLLTVTRMDKFFDRTPIVNEGRLSGKTKKPRDLLVPSSGLEIEPGMPIFGEGGVTVGVIVVQAPDEEEQAAASRMGTAALILPAAEVVKATKRAHETAAAEDEEDEEGEGDTVKKTAKDAGDKLKKDAAKLVPAKPAVPANPAPPTKPAE